LALAVVTFLICIGFVLTGMGWARFILVEMLGIASLSAAGTMDAPARDKEGDTMAMILSSTVFSQNGGIPKKFTCDGDDISPPLAWSGVPAGTKSLVLVVDDPDAPDPAAPKMTWVHWVLYNIPAGVTGLPEAVKTLPPGTLQALNDWKRTGYGGPCPPIGRHRYFHKLYALDTMLPDLGKPTKAVLEKNMQGHILEKTELIGTYTR
jgi:Raf kinase inhibitor-like YbhB/YbcL family protein